MLRRKIEKDIMHWIESSEKALLVYGVRQAGKTYIIRKCLKKAGCDYVEFNLIKQPEIVTILANATGIDDLILKLSLFSDQRIVPGKTVFFFDEIQKYKEIVTKIKFLVDDKRFRYVLLTFENNNLSDEQANTLLKGKDHLAKILDRWKVGSFEGLIARGGFKVSAQWTDGKVVRCSVHGQDGKAFRLKINGECICAVGSYNYTA